MPNAEIVCYKLNTYRYLRKFNSLPENKQLKKKKIYNNNKLYKLTAFSDGHLSLSRSR